MMARTRVTVVAFSLALKTAWASTSWTAILAASSGLNPSGFTAMAHTESTSAAVTNSTPVQGSLNWISCTAQAIVVCSSCCLLTANSTSLPKLALILAASNFLWGGFN